MIRLETGYEANEGKGWSTVYRQKWSGHAVVDAAGSGVLTYMAPIVNTNTTHAFFFLVIRRFQTPPIGIKRIMTSVTVLKNPLILIKASKLIHCPGTDGFQIRSLGVHCQIFAAVEPK